jgi:hypothetical protein
MAECLKKRRKMMTELKIVMDEYGTLFAILPNGDMRKILADVYANPYYGAIRIGETIEEENNG